MQAIIQQIDKEDNGQARIFVLFTDNATIKVGEWIIVTAADLNGLKRQLQDRINQIQSPFTLVDTLALGALDLTITTTPPTQAEIDKAQFFSDLSNYQQFQNLVNLKILTGSEKEVTDLLSKIKTEYKASYFA